MAFTNTKESGLESLIVKWLVEQNGYEEGTNADYNKEYAVDETRLFRFLQDTQPKEMDKLGVRLLDSPLAGLLARVVFVIDKQGILRYTQVVPEITTEPDYDAVLAEVKKVL